jgi:hypothetical protein
VALIDVAGTGERLAAWANIDVAELPPVFLDRDLSNRRPS